MNVPDPLPSLSPRDAEAIQAALRRFHRSVLALIAACALAVFIQTGAEASELPRQAVIGVVLAALVAILARRFATSPVMATKPRVVLSVIGLAATAGIAITGAALPHFGADQQQGLAFVLGAGLLALRPPSVLPARPA